jgi:hypothetical protein
MRTGPILVLLLIPIAIVPARFAKATTCPTFGSIGTAGTIDDTRLNEVSGLQASLDHRRVLWGVEDSGNGPYLWAFGTDGSELARFTVRGPEVANLDWEALALTHRRGHDILWIGDVGDNSDTRDGTHRPLPALERLREPSIHAGVAYREDRHVRATRFRFRYHARSGAVLGPRNAEALFADPRSHRLFVVEKQLETIHGHAGRARVFALRPHDLRARRVNAARQVATIVGTLHGGAGPVAADMSRDGAWILIKNYGFGWLWPRANHEDVGDVFAADPEGPCTMPVDGAEAIAFGYGRGRGWHRAFSVRERGGGDPPLNVTPRT